MRGVMMGKGKETPMGTHLGHAFALCHETECGLVGAEYYTLRGGERALV
jgi:hypothetical protein